MGVILNFLILILCASENNGESTAAVKFEIKTRTEQGIEEAYCVLKPDQDLTVTEGSSVRIDAEWRQHIQKSSCYVESTQTELKTPFNDDFNQDAWFLMVKNIKKEQSGSWSCSLGFGNPNTSIDPNLGGYTTVSCKVNVIVQEHKPPDVTDIQYRISHDNGIPRCKTSAIGPFQENERIQVITTSTAVLKGGDCFLVDNTEEPIDVPNDRFLNFSIEDQDSKRMRSEIKTLNYWHNGKYLICRFNIDVGDPEKRKKETHCREHQLVIQRPSELQGRNLGEDNTVIIISCVVGIIVVLIIVGQTIALVYFKTRAQEGCRLDSLVTRDRHFDRNEEARSDEDICFKIESQDSTRTNIIARYSAPPSRRNTKSGKATSERDSHIYEMVGVNALYKESSELDIQNRPPLPLPEESPVPPPVPIDTLPRPPKSKLMSSTLSLNSISSQPTPAKAAKKKLPPTPAATMSKVPCRPPKPDSKLPGSLPRPPKPGSSLPKMLPTDPAFLELKKAIEKRNFGNASPSPSVSQQSTLEMKPKPPPTLSRPAPKAPIGGVNPKPPMGGVNPLAPVGGVNPKPPMGGVNPLAPIGGVNPKPPMGGVNPLAPIGGVNPKPPMGGVNPLAPVGGVNPLAPNVKLILPKIEASLRPPPTVKTPKTEATGSSGPTHPQKAIPSFRSPDADVSPPSPYPVPQLPPQGLVQPRPLPPIQPDDDDGQYSDDDEWTYEQLEKYNIYNV